jgi:hypothetical protein
MDSFANRKKECLILPAANLSMSVESEWFLAVGLMVASRLTSRSFCLFKVIASNINYRSSGVSLSLVLSAGLYSLLFSSLLSRSRLFERWDRAFKAHLRHGCLSPFILCLCCCVCR